MLQYLRTGPHLQALQASRTVGRYGKVYGYHADEIPDWEQARKIWKRVIVGQPNADFGDEILEPP